MEYLIVFVTSVITLAEKVVNLPPSLSGYWHIKFSAKVDLDFFKAIRGDGSQEGPVPSL